MLNFKFKQYFFILILSSSVFTINSALEENPEAPEFQVEDHEQMQGCHINRSEIERHFSTKTPYRVIANLDDTPYKYPNCRPYKIWSIIRHGSRNPSGKDINRANTDLVRFKEYMLNESDTKLCAEELSQLREWRFNATLKEKKYLVTEGETELIELAERMQKRFPELLPQFYHPNLYYFKYTKTQRTLKSAESFAAGLLGRDHIKEIEYPTAVDGDPILRVSNGFK